MLTDHRGIYISLIIVFVLNLTACLGGGRAPVYSREEQKTKTVEQKPVPQKVIPGSRVLTNPTLHKGYYTVVRGDTLYSIAWRYQLDYKQLSKWNGIRSPYLIHVGKKLRLTAPPQKPVQRVAKTEKPKPYPKPKPPAIKKKSAQVVKKDSRIKSTPKKLPANVTWHWPAKGKLISSNTVSSRNGIDIKGKMGQTIKAAAAGNIVYSGRGLVGYGNLIIIKHNKTFLSAYAHNSRLLVGEGTRVSAGQPIAEMGNSATNMIKLHFEIRKDGKSVDPLKYLPK